MTNNWALLKSYFFDYLEGLPSDAFLVLDRCKKQHPDLVEELKGLIQNHRDSSGFLEEPDAENPDLKSSIDLQGYELKRLIAKGGMGTVYLVANANKQLFALKTMNKSILQNHLSNRFSIEINSLSSLDHPGIAKYFGAGELDSRVPYLLMEYVPGLTLRKALSSLQLTIQQRRTIYLQICDAVQYAHENGFVHRDLNPGNIMLQQQPSLQIKLIDFGIVKSQNHGLSVTALTGTGTIVGTPPFIAPEQINAELGSIGPQADIFNLGLLASKLFGTPLPYDLVESDSISSYCDKLNKPVFGNLPTEKKHLKQQLTRLIERACVRDVQERTPRVDELRKAFLEIPIEELMS